MNKSKVIVALDQLPNEFPTEELIEELLFVEKIECVPKYVEDGKVVS